MTLGEKTGIPLLAGAILSFFMLASLPAWTSQFGIPHTIRNSSFAARSDWQPVSSQNRNDAGPSTATRSAFDAEERHRLIVQIVAYLNQFYVDRGLAQKTTAAVLAHETNGDDASATDPAAFARLVTAQMRAASDDHDLELVYSAEPLPILPPLTPSAQPVSASYRAAMLHSNCGFERVELLSHNVGYIELSSFPELSVCRQKAVAAMSEINDAKAVIFDLRENHGGFGNMTAFIASYLFDHPEYWYSPRDNTSKESWLRSPVAGNKLAATPVYVLTSGQTISAAEQFTYNLKMLKRATIVGETTAGAAHAGVFHRIDEHFGIAITEVKSINPYSKYDWNGSGIEPDVKTPAAGALKAATGLIDKNDRRK